jgi:glycosyltransferase involved in cell wall biosynthesis
VNSGDIGSLPCISIVTPSFNQGKFIGRTIESVLDQGYPRLEHIVVDGMSTDETPEVLSRYEHLRVIREPDKGQADAINKGFKQAAGEILCYLNSDDTLLPGALHRIAKEIDPGRGRHIVMGRCRFIDESDVFLGIEHPSAFESHRRVLEIWKGHCIPQPAVFWTSEVWQRCGPLREDERLVLDYDLFCRFSSSYYFHPIDQVLATYRLHAGSKTTLASDDQRLRAAIKVSRRYWGPPTSINFWRLTLSYGAYRLDRRRRAATLLRSGRERWREARRLSAARLIAAGVLLGPDVVTDAVIIPKLRPRLNRVLRKDANQRRPLKQRLLVAQSLMWRDFVGLHEDGWAGPTLVMPISVETGQKSLEFKCTTGGFQVLSEVEFGCWIDDVPVDHEMARRGKEFSIKLPLGDLEPGDHELRIVANTYVVPNDNHVRGDFRPLSFRILDRRFE